jgi:hypothetical protein
MTRVPSCTIARVSLYSAGERLVGEVHDQARTNLVIRGCAGGVAEPVGAAGPDRSPREGEDEDEGEGEDVSEVEDDDEGW